MRRQNETFKYSLNPQAIDECSAKAKAFAGSIRLPEKDCLRYAYTVDDILLKSFDEHPDAEISLTTGIKFFRPFMIVRIVSEPFNAFAGSDEDGSLYGNSVLRNLGLSPEYSYTDGANNYFFSMRKKRMNPFFTLMLSLGLAIVCSLLGLLAAPEFRAAVLDNFLTPIYDTFFNVLGCIAGPMVFLSVAWGIYGIGDAASLKKIGKRLLGNYIGTVFLISAVFSLVCLKAFSLGFSSVDESGHGLNAIFTMILDIIPRNIFSPFIEGNTLQIIFLAVVIGIALLFLGQKTTSVARAVEQINYIVQFLVEFICRLVPFFIFIAIVEMIWSDAAEVLRRVGKFFEVLIACIIINTVVMLLYTSIKNRISMISLFKKGLPTLLIALSTASSAAAFGQNINACNKSYGIDKKITAFGIPLGMVVFKPSTAISYLAISLFCCSAYNIEISLSWFVIMIFTVAILAIATPPVPGGAITAYTVMFAQLGIPAEALAIAIACDTLADFITTGFDQFLIPLELLNQASRLGKVNRDILCKK